MKIDMAVLTRIASLIGPAGAIIGTVVEAIAAIRNQPGRDPAAELTDVEVLGAIDQARGRSQVIRNSIAEQRAALRAAAQKKLDPTG